ncbi:MAG: hydantoinase/oxoprolinase family protein, partial [Alphaproteobacteria bacterium]|nr:hydantoinase/oxoprolinase family protein [Alphaproteobacteria bacterium]
VIHGTTLVANALIERKGVKVALLTTKGFRDVLEIAKEWRYDIYDLSIRVPEPLVPRALRFEVGERMLADGTVRAALDEAGMREVAAAIAASGVGAVAICFLHAYANDAHERRAEAILREVAPGLRITRASALVPELGEFERASTAVANAYVQPVFDAYVQRLEEGLQKGGLRRGLYLMLSDGGTVTAAAARAFPIRLVQSGPAGGAQAAALFGALASERRVMAFDMGGTTAKACLIEDGEPDRAVDFEVARVFRFKRGSGLPLKVPVADMIEIGAGGGSIARIDRLGLVQVGPDSSGSDPGPACYGLGGTLPTVSDADLMLGYLDAGSFLGGDMVLKRELAEQALAEHLGKPLGMSAAEAAWAIHETVNEAMAQAASIHALEKAKRASDYALVALGGAGPVHACHVARKMGVRRVIAPLGAGVASALGMLAAPTAFAIGRAQVAALSALDLKATAAMLGALEQEGRDLVAGAGVPAAAVSVRRTCLMRYAGQGHEVEAAVPDAFIAAGDRAALAESFAAAYRALYGRTE